MRTVKKVPFDAAEVTVIPPIRTDDRYRNSQLTELGPAFMIFDEAAATNRWTLNYEEILYVIEGEVTLIVYGDDGTYSVRGEAGDVITIGKGSTVEYAGTKGARAFVVFTPLNWRELLATASQ